VVIRQRALSGLAPDRTETDGIFVKETTDTSNVGGQHHRTCVLSELLFHHYFLLILIIDYGLSRNIRRNPMVLSSAFVLIGQAQGAILQ